MNTVQAEEKQRYRLGDFEGPLDLLLFLIKKSE
ncbi:MAG: segregation/condensation protein A, partial [Spirochaetales bacterium]